MEPELNHDIAEAPTEEEIEGLKQEKGIVLDSKNVENEISTTQKTIKARFKSCEYPEHVEQGLKEILDLVTDVTDLSDEEWIEVFEELKDSVEFRESEWTNR